ncbi:MAG: DinB family protein [Chloroflexota bacterium]|nr:DinB family protein [Chloroflexota bacterium]
MDAICEAALATFDEQAGTLRTVMAGLPDEALTWTPGAEANSISALVAHAWGSAQAWTARVAGREIERDRAAEFRVAATGAALTQLLADGRTRIAEHLAAVDPAAYGELWVPSPDQAGGRDDWTRARCLVHALEHSQEHVGQALLTRQLWEQRQPN